MVHCCVESQEVCTHLQQGEGEMVQSIVTQRMASMDFESCRCTQEKADACKGKGTVGEQGSECSMASTCWACAAHHMEPFDHRACAKQDAASRPHCSSQPVVVAVQTSIEGTKPAAEGKGKMDQPACSKGIRGMDTKCCRAEAALRCAEEGKEPLDTPVCSQGI